MSALSTPGGGGTTAQTKPTSGKQKYQKLDINSLYCTNRNENSEPSLVKSQLSRKHGMQSLGKVPSARRPPANLPSLKTETGQDPNVNSISAVTTTVSTPTTCSTQTIPTTSSSSVAVSTCPSGWVSLPPPSSPHFRTEFPSLEASAQPSHRSSDHSTSQPQLRPQTEGSWTCGGTAGVRQETTSPAAAPVATTASQQTPAFRAILPSFLVKGSSGGGLGLGTLGSLRDNRAGAGVAGGAGAGSGSTSNAGPRPASRAPATPRAVEVLTARPILREEEISSLDDISRDAGWAQHDDIDYDQKLDFSDGESSAPTKATNNKNNNRSSIETERVDTKIQEPADEEQIWAERRQKQNNEVAQVIARARQRKEEEQRRQMRDTVAPTQSTKDCRDRVDRERDRNDNRDREPDIREKERVDNRERERPDNRERDRADVREKDRNELRDRDGREMDRAENRERDRIESRDRFDNRDRDRDVRDRDRDRERDRLDSRDRGRNENRDRHDSEKDRIDLRDRDRNDNRDRSDRIDRDRFERDRERTDRDRERDRDRPDRDRNDRDRDRDRDFRERDREYGRERDQANPAFSKTFQANIPPRFLKQQQNRQQEEQHKAWQFSGKAAPRRQEQPASYTNAPRHAPHNGRRSYSRDFSDREEEFRRDKDGPGPQWRSEMQDYDRPGRELDRSNSKDSYKEYGDYKDRRNEPERKSIDISGAIEHSSRTAADKLTEVFERKSIGIADSYTSADSSTQPQVPERRNSPPSSIPQRDSVERDFGKTSWAEITQDESSNYSVSKISNEKVQLTKDEQVVKDSVDHGTDKSVPQQPPVLGPPPQQIASHVTIPPPVQNMNHKYNNLPSGKNFVQAQQIPQINPYVNTQSPITAPISQSQTFSDNNISTLKPMTLPTTTNDSLSTSQIQKQSSSEQLVQQNLIKPVFTSQKSEKELSESESIASKSSVDPSGLIVVKVNEASVESLLGSADSQKRPNDDKRNERFSNEQLNKIPGKEPVERKSSGSGSEKKGRGYGGGGYAVYNRGWGSRESRGRRSHRSSRSNNRASESDGSTDGAPHAERKERRRAPRSPRGPKKPDRQDDNRSNVEPISHVTDNMENREPFAPRGQPSRRGRGGFQGASRPPAPAKRVTGYGPPNTKSPFSQASRAIKDNEDGKENVQSDDKGKSHSKPRTGSSTGRGRDRRPKGGPGGPLSGEDENWETTSEHSEGGGASGRRTRQSGQAQKGQGGRNQNPNNRQNNNRNSQVPKKDLPVDGRTTDITEAMVDLKLTSGKKEDEIVDDGFQEVRNKKNSKDTRGPSTKEENIKPPRSHSNQGGGRNGSSTRNSSDKSNNTRGSVAVSSKPVSQYDRPRQANLAPRFVKQRQKQQMGMVSGFGPDTGAAPPPPPVNAWDKPISQTLRANVEDPVEVTDTKSSQSSQRSSPGDVPIEVKPAPAASAVAVEITGVLDGATPPVETIIFENTNYKTAPPAEALKQKYQPSANTAKPQGEELQTDIDARSVNFNGDVRTRPRSIQELMTDNSRPVTDGESTTLGLQMPFDTSQKAEDSSDMKLDFTFDSDSLGQLTEDKTTKSLGLQRGVHMSTSNTISPLAADLNLKIASVKKVWEMPAVAEGTEELQFPGFEETNTETGAPPNVCKVKPTQQLQSPPPQHYNHVGYQGGYGGLSVPSPPAVLFNSSQQLLGSSQQLPQQGGLYGAFLDQSRGQFGTFPGTPYGAGSAAPYNYQPPPDMFQSLPNQYRMAGGGAAFGQSGQLGNSPSTVLISSTSNSLMSATVKPSTQQIGAIGHIPVNAGSKGGAVGGVGGVGGVSTYQQQYLGYSGPVGEAPYSLPGLLPRPAPPASSYYSPYQPPAAPAPTYPLQFTQPAQSGAFGSQFISSQLQVVQQMQQQYRTPMQQQYAPPQPRPPPQQQLKSPLHEHANGFAQLCESASPTPKGTVKPQKPPHSPPQHKYHAPPPHPPPSHTPHQHHPQHAPHQQQQMMAGGNNGRCGGGGGALARGGLAPRYPAPIQRPPMPLYRSPAAPAPAPPSAPRPHHAQQRPNLYYHHHQRNGAGGGERATEGVEGAGAGDEPSEAAAPVDVPPVADVKAE